MPIYEFYCPDCHTIYNFFARRIDTRTIPACPSPGCDNPALERRMSVFAISKGRKEGEEDDPFADIDESRMESVLASLESEIDGIDDDDPRQAAQVMRKLYEATGMKLGPGMEEAIRRMEAGEDPDKVEEELGDALEEEPMMGARTKAGLRDLRNRLLPPRVDETLYDLQ